MRKAFLPILASATLLLIPFALSGCGSDADNPPSEEMNKEHDHHGHEH